MLDSIKGFDKKTREGILSEIALEFGRPSFVGNNSLEYDSVEAELDELKTRSLFDTFKKTWSDPNDVRLLAVAEIFHRLSMKDSELFQYARGRVLNFIGREIRELALNSSHISSARKRLGQKGILPPNAYKVKFSQEFHDICEPLGITKKEVTLAINSPDMYEHFVPEVQESAQAISLYVKFIPNGADPYSLLVDAFRVGDILSVHFAIRAYHSDIDVTSIAKPTDLLRGFTDIYGSELSIGAQKGKLILNEKISSSTFTVTSHHQLGRSVVHRGSNRKLASGETEVCLAYGVDVGLYAEYLRLHGSKVRKGFPS